MSQELFSVLTITDVFKQVSLLHYCLLTSLMFTIGLVGIMINRKNLIMVLMAIELMLLAVNCNFVIFSHFLNNVDGQIVVFFILAVAATESAIGLTILILLYNQKKSIAMLDINKLRN